MKLRVWKDYGAVHIGRTDGSTEHRVRGVTDVYGAGGFGGMIHLACAVDRLSNWGTLLLFERIPCRPVRRRAPSSLRAHCSC